MRNKLYWISPFLVFTFIAVYLRGFTRMAVALVCTSVKVQISVIKATPHLKGHPGVCDMLDLGHSVRLLGTCGSTPHSCDTRIQCHVGSIKEQSKLVFLHIAWSMLCCVKITFFLYFFLFISLVVKLEVVETDI